MNPKERFITIFTEQIKRTGATELLHYLTQSDFFVAPASTRFHLSCEGGLLQHSLNVYDRMKKIVEMDAFEITEESLAVCALLHDVCKVGFYELGSRNVKDEKGSWQKVPMYTVRDSLPFGHGEKSVYILSSFIKLSRPEAMAINWHMGGFDDRVKGGSHALSQVFDEYPMTFYLHLADMMATNLDEKENK